MELFVMAQADPRSLEEIRRDAESARAGLTATVDQLKTTVNETASDVRHRISPDSIKAEVSGYIKSRGEAMLDSITEAVRANPLQALAIGASVAVPALRVIRAIPVPVLMVGAGLYLAGTPKGRAVARQANDMAKDLAGEAARRGREIGADVSEAANAARDYAADRYQAVSGAVASGAADLKDKAADLQAKASEKAGEIGGSISSSIDGLRQQAIAGDQLSGEAQELAVRGGAASAEFRDSAQQAVSSFRDSAADTAARWRDSVASTAEAGLETAAQLRNRARERASDLGHRAAEIGDRTGKTIVQTVSEHPFLVAGLGLVVGGLIASALPRTRIEDRLVGSTARDLKDRARDMATGGLEGVKEAATGAYQEVARSAEEAGLSADNLSGAAKEAGQRARRVAEAASSTLDTPPHNKH
jgi:hypothetical protein